ncbi:MAG TPA: carboxypeptidase-like regulatory domain-containing protein [Anaeromyxobacteraceae bacterium]|nr:carboxypeptidase-like regulatory domain-containing protein [Anaeromyxobacteraceae bacterium]
MRPLLALAAALPLLAAAEPPPGRVAGRVVDARGAPVARFTVNGQLFYAGDGRYAVALPGGDSRLVFRADGRAPAVVTAHATLGGTSGRRHTLPDVVLGGGVDLIGEVVDARTGDPLPAARAALAGSLDVGASPAQPDRLSDLGGSGNGGAYLLRHAARGGGLLLVTHPDYLPAAVPVRPGAPLPTVALQRGGVIAGRAVGADGRPVAGARIVAASAVAGDAQEVLTDASGAFRLARLRPGSYSVAATGAPGTAAAAEAVTVREGETTRVGLSLRPRLPRTAALTSR